MNSFVRILNLVLINWIVNNKLDGAKVQQLSLLAMNKKLCTNEKCQIKMQSVDYQPIAFFTFIVLY